MNSFFELLVLEKAFDRVAVVDLKKAETVFLEMLHGELSGN